MHLEISKSTHYDFGSMASRKRKSTWGGARPGAGRKPIFEAPVRVTFDLEKRDYEALAAFAERKGISVSKSLRMAVQAHLRRLGRR
jgi:hypothetical protein